MPAKRKKKTMRSLAFLNTSKSRALLVVLIVGLLGVGYFLYQTFALQAQVKYWGALTSSKPTATYKLTTGAGTMNVAFSNNTADVTLVMKNSANQVIGSLASKGKTDVKLSVSVTPDTYSFTLKPTKPFTSNKGYKIAINYPVQELTPATKPTAVITSPTGTSTVSGTVDFNADAKDAKGIGRVEFYVDSKLIGTDSVAPYGVKWDTKTVSDGVHQLAVKAYNLAGLIGEASGPVTVKQPVTVAANDKFGYSAPASDWDTRLAALGVGADHIKYRRIYLKSFDDSLSLAKRAQADGMIPVISYKTGGYTWAQVASGAADAQIRTAISNLNAISGPKIVAIHHEPAKDGTDTDWAKMQLHALPMFKSGANQTQISVIGNGWWWSSLAKHLTDAEIARYIPSNLISILDYVAGDLYGTETGTETGAVKIANMVAWAKRVGGVKAIGIGEWNEASSAANITKTMNAIKSEPLVKWACMWDSGSDGVGLKLTGARLEAFKAGLATPNQT